MIVKEGDAVRTLHHFISNEKSHKKGDILFIEEISNSSDIVTIKCEGSIFTFWLDYNDVEIVKVRKNKLSRKIYPHYREDGDYLICTKKMNQ